MELLTILELNLVHLQPFYSGESFYDISDGHSPRITSIAVHNYETAQTDSFSIHKMAEKAHFELSEIDNHFDELEKAMLDDFFHYAQRHGNFFWIHWNMRDMNYGFKAIEHRYSVLGGSPFEIPDSNKIDLARQLINCYGRSYIGHPRMTKLLEKNNISMKDFLSGEQEASAFKNREYIKLHMSTLRKVHAFVDILNKAINNKLKVESKWSEIYGISVEGIFNFCKDTWWIQIIWTFLSMILGGVIGFIINTMMGGIK